jgi:hypothetical protein
MVSARREIIFLMHINSLDNVPVAAANAGTTAKLRNRGIREIRRKGGGDVQIHLITMLATVAVLSIAPVWEVG